MIGLLEFHATLSEILLTACADQLLNNWNLIKFCLTCAEQNAAVRIASDACSMLKI